MSITRSFVFTRRGCSRTSQESWHDSGGNGQEVQHQLRCLQLILKPRSLVIIGAKKSIWQWQERKLHRALIRRGHDVILVYVISTSLKSRSQLVIHHLLEEVSEKESHNERRNRDYGGVPQAYVSSAAAGRYHRQAVRGSDPTHPGQHGESPPTKVFLVMLPTSLRSDPARAGCPHSAQRSQPSYLLKRL